MSGTRRRKGEALRLPRAAAGVEQHDKQADRPRGKAKRLRAPRGKHVDQDAGKGDQRGEDQDRHAPQRAPWSGRVVRLSVEMPPPAKNRRHRIGKGRHPQHHPRAGQTFPIIVPSAEADAWSADLALAWHMSREKPIDRGLWRIEVHTVWTRWRDLGDIVVPFGDSDATISSVKDALQKCGAIDDDVRIDCDICTRSHGPAPRVDIVLVELEPVGEQGDLFGEDGP